MSEQPYGQDKQKQSAGQGKNHLLAGVELQMLLVPRTDTGDADQQYRGYLAVHEMAVLIDRPSLDTSVDVSQYAAPLVEYCRVNGILEELQQNRHIDDCTEYLVESL
jgi:hypothetical protein